MRFLAFILTMSCAGFMPFASSVSAENTAYIAAQVDSDLIVTQGQDRVALYGVRLVNEDQDAALYQKAMDYLTRTTRGAAFTLDTQAFEKLGMAKNRYGDLFGKIVLSDGSWLQERLIAEGYGIWSGAPGYPTELRERLVRAEQGAFLENLGIWRKFKIINANQPERQYWDGQFIIAKGIVREVYRGASATYLNFGEDWKKDFTVAIPSRSRRKFEQGGWTIDDLRNRSITVRGLVRFYNGPYLEIDFPEQLEINEAIGEG
jgi:endonuclease YncB( thermonuclease family)